LETALGLIDKILAARGIQASDAEKRDVVRAYADTFAVIHAGWGEPVARNIRRLYPNVPSPLAAANKAADPEQAALVWGAAAHALDFDDVHTVSVTHPSAVLIPAIESVVQADSLSRDRVAGAFLLGVAVNVALGEALGYSHYDKGWHATSTIGPLAAAAAVAYLLNLDETSFRAALSLAAAQAGGMQRNFGAQAKPVQAGLAAAAGVRAARMAASGITAAPDAFAEKGYLDLYGGRQAGRPVAEIDVGANASTLSRKLYGCCYQAHRPIAAALLARKQLDTSVLKDPTVKVEVRVPFGGSAPLRFPAPKLGLEAKFSGPYAVAAALIDGHVRLKAFDDAEVQRADLQDLLRRTVLIEDALDGAMPVGIDVGTIRLSVKRGDKILASSEVAHFPGSPAWPMTNEELESKVCDCVAYNGGATTAADILTAAKTAVH
jgi:2-methylcitrate dehydratase PrpD